MVTSALQTVPVLVAASALGVTVLFFLLRGSAGGRKRLPVTLQDPTVKYPLRLVNKQVDTLIICAAGSIHHRKDVLKCNETDLKHQEGSLEMVSVSLSICLSPCRKSAMTQRNSALLFRLKTTSLACQ